METDLATDFLKEVGDFVGIQEIAFDQNGFCLLQLQDQFAFILRIDKERQRLVMIAEFANPVEISKELFSAILSFHFLQVARPGPWIALDKETGAFFLVEAFSVLATTKEAFKEHLVLFFEQYTSCQGLFNGATVEALMEKEASPSLSEWREMA